MRSSSGRQHWGICRRVIRSTRSRACRLRFSDWLAGCLRTIDQAGKLSSSTPPLRTRGMGRIFYGGGNAQTSDPDKAVLSTHAIEGNQANSLVQGLGLQYDKLLRECERPTPIRGAACCLFWTLGGSQVGRAAISGWQEVVAPARRRGAKLWPFEGSLAELARAGYPVIAETYPAEAYSHVGIRFPRNGSKRRQHDRAFATKGIFEWASRNQVTFCELLVNQIEMGFGPHEDGEDPFDALAGILSMIEVLDGRRSEGPENGSAHVWEGWILGQPSVSTISQRSVQSTPGFWDDGRNNLSNSP